MVRQRYFKGMKAGRPYKEPPAPSEEQIAYRAYLIRQTPAWQKRQRKQFCEEPYTVPECRTRDIVDICSEMMSYG